jgi:hypothetical protein
MRTSIIAFTAVLALAASPALADGYSYGAPGGSVKGEQANQQEARSSAGAAINQNFEAGHKDKSIDTTPTAIAPGLDAGTNNCAVSASAGGSATGFGLSFGASWESEDCNERNWIALMSSRGWDDVAQAYACLHNAKMAMAFEAAGYECPDAPGEAERRAAEDQVAKNEASGEPAVPSYCSDGGFASDDVIRKNCPESEADRILSDRNW